MKKFMPIFEELSDGSEIEWREYEVNQDPYEKMVVHKKELQAFEPLTTFED